MGRKVRKTKLRNGLTAEMERFCQLYATKKEFFGNGAASYAAVMGKDLSNPKQYKVAATMASRWLKKVEVIERINQLLVDREGIDSEYVDKQLAFLVTQMIDFKVKLGAIREYNRITGRDSFGRRIVRRPEPIPRN